MSKAINLEVELNAVWQAQTLEGKKVAMRTLIEKSHAKAETKRKALIEVDRATSVNKLDKFAFNYMASGEGMKVL
jgi:hypothetical protein